MPRYYYAGGERVPIEPDERQVAIDVARAGRAAVDDIVKSAGTEARRNLPSRLVVVPRSAVGRAGLADLEAAGAVQPVYRHESSVLVPLPEVRVELEAGQRTAVLAALAASPVPFAIVDDADGRIVVRPESGSGDDAIAIANYVFEKARPAASAVNFVRFVPRPIPKPPTRK